MTPDLHSLNVVDIAALVLVVLGALQGLRRGLSGELARLAGMIAAYLAGLWLHEPVAAWCMARTRLEYGPARALAFALTVLGALALLMLVHAILGRAMKLVIAEGLDRIGGMAAGAARAGIVVLVIFLVVNLLTPDSYLGRLFGEASAIGRRVQAHGPMVRERLREEWQRLDVEGVPATPDAAAHRAGEV